MLLVALSRRMCCSRVCNASRYAGRPSASCDTPTSRPGMWRLYIRCDDNKRTRVMHSRNEFGVIVNRAIGGGILNECAENRVVELKTRVIADLDLNAEWFRACLNDGDCLRVTIICDKKRFPIWNGGVTKRHRLRGSCGFVQE